MASTYSTDEEETSVCDEGLSSTLHVDSVAEEGITSTLHIEAGEELSYAKGTVPPPPIDFFS